MSDSIQRVAMAMAAAAVAAVLVGWLSADTAMAQMKLNLPTQSEDSRTDEQKKADAERRKAVDDAYKKATDSIPDAKQKRDPWKNTR